MDNPVAYFDLDGTLADYSGQMDADLEKIRAPEEPVYHSSHYDNTPQYLIERMDLIKSNGEWWENLPRFQLGWDILEQAVRLDFRIIVLTQGPRNNAVAWSHKVKWCMKNLPDSEIVITRDKGLSYGRVLVDDYPDYILRWLKWRPRGTAIMPAHDYNKDFSHPRVVRYDGKNIDEVIGALNKAFV